MECYCDYERAELSAIEMRKARKRHHCDECGRTIWQGEQYEYTRSLLGGAWLTNRTCWQCLELREWVKAHIPCFCWAHGYMLEDARNALESLRHETSDTAGVLFGAGRRLVAIRRERQRKGRAPLR